jgi:hypothetical protein
MSRMLCIANPNPKGQTGGTPHLAIQRADLTQKCRPNNLKLLIPRV